MVAGALDHEAGSRDIDRARRPRAARCRSAFAAALLAGASMAGLPPFFGFLAKEEIYAALGFAGGWTSVFTIVALAGNALMVTIALTVALKPFLGAEMPARRSPRMRGRCCCGSGRWCWPWLGPLAALFAGQTHHFLSSSMASAVAGTPVEIDITTVPHLGLPLLLSALTIALGVAVYAVPGRGAPGGCRPARRHRLGTGPRLRPGDARPVARRLRDQPRRPERPARRLHDGHLHRHRAGAAGADGAVRRMAGCAWLAAQLQFHEWAVLAIAVIGLVAVRSRQQSPDGDRLARHPGLCRGAAVHAARRAGPLVHPVHDRDAVGGDPGAGDDAAEAVADRSPAAACEAVGRHRRAAAAARLRTAAAQGDAAAVRRRAERLLQRAFARRSRMAATSST